MKLQLEMDRVYFLGLLLLCCIGLMGYAIYSGVKSEDGITETNVLQMMNGICGSVSVFVAIYLLLKSI